MTLSAKLRETFADGLIYIPNYLTADEQTVLLGDVADAIKSAPLFQPCMPKTGKPFSVKMTNCGELGWVSDRTRGYRYEPVHPETGRPWPAIPPLALRSWAELGGYVLAPQACLINIYDLQARMGLHQDRDEDDFAAPVVSLSLGESCIFRWGHARAGKTQALTLASGDALVLAGRARLAFHGVARILPGTSDILPGRRINLTLRRVTKLKK
jgi:DNA oxidative demethylase